jgi:hypothetical protein
MNMYDCRARFCGVERRISDLLWRYRNLLAFACRVASTRHRTRNKDIPIHSN